MSALDLLHEVHQRGGNLHVDGERVRIDAPIGAVDEGLKKRLREHKLDLILAYELERHCAGLRVLPPFFRPQANSCPKVRFARSTPGGSSNSRSSHQLRRRIWSMRARARGTRS